ncbi:hypothetical protein N7493_004870 [Penicillium malachiteum]|uniref:Uncharacterized protein n=1 Tax=Penicillium malachiteum TaxID=1324776 RepID=A0AAD6MW13_9EURO|nr:hypothetical protein N7493_004870 [Penicillium malachiteum]
MLPTMTSTGTMESRLTNKRWLFCLSICGLFSAVSFIISFASSGNIPPTKPWWDADTVKLHYLKHEKGTQVATIFLFLSGAFFLPFSTAIATQIRLIPTIHPAIPDLQLACAAASVCIWMISATFMSLLTFRDYSAELVQLLNDAMWLSILMSWPIFWIQFWTISWAVFSDCSPDPVFPKLMGWVNLLSPIVLALASGIHMHHSGAMAWNGGLVFWPTLAVYAVEINCCCWYLVRNIRRGLVGSTAK